MLDHAKCLKHLKKTKKLNHQHNRSPILFLSDKEDVVAPSEGLEPSTHALTVRCSTELSYDGSITNLSGVAIVRICGTI